MIITIQGYPKEGKTTLARKICEGKKVFYTEEHRLNSPFWTDGLDSTFDYILIDNVKDFDKAYSNFRSDYLTVESRGKRNKIIKTPDVILVQ